MKPLKKVRCSSLPRVFRCLESLDEPEGIVIEHDNEAGRLGTAVHEMLRINYSDGLNGEIAQNTCAANGIQQKDVWPLVNSAKNIVKELGLGIPDVMEDEIADGILTGHPDAEWTLAGYYWIGDWKTSRLDPDYFHQLMGYAWIRREHWRHLRGCNMLVAWLRDGTVERYLVTLDAVERWYAGLQERLASEKRAFVTGDHCSFCKRCSDCPAQREDLRQALTVIDEGFAIDLSQLDGPMKAKVHRKLKMIANIKEHWDEALRNDIRAHGPIDCGDGFKLALVPEKGRREIDTLKAWPALESRLTDEELASCLKVGVTAIQDAVAKKAPSRKGAEAKRKLWADLEERGAVTQGTVDKLKEIRSQNLPTETKEIEE